ncbi:hypothetical protein [Photobacterium atrarenae]|uniref:Uncharacterized protein n=1 Tax=Photobacterium atrarenae TaxID=865757 RepID=A0ABY5GQS7_9GAMM|nr:hypothetical protein [Photobacterium atrarenae]UTV30882.1 hypothetical protein NNL38_20205 [Photobacterium atrarenae]
MFALMLAAHKPAATLRRGDVVSLSGNPYDAAPVESVQAMLGGKVLVKQIGCHEQLIGSDNRVAVFCGCRRN